jgi:hypothetical protein
MDGADSPAPLNSDAQVANLLMADLLVLTTIRVPLDG